MTKMQGSDGLIGKRNIAILNKKNLAQMKCQSACYNKLKMGLYVEFGWEMAVWERKENQYNKKALNTRRS
jgi:hypothetical protein